MRSGSHAAARTRLRCSPAVGIGLGALALCLTGCTVSPPPADDALSPYPGGMSRRQFGAYAQLDRVILDDGDSRWIVTPRSVLELSAGHLRYEFGPDEGILGSIQSAAQDGARIWVGTERAIQVIDKDLHFVRTVVDEAGLECRFLASLDRVPRFDDDVRITPGRAVALTAYGAGVLDGATLAYANYPFDGLDLRRVTDVVLFEDAMWVATRQGLLRFSLSFNSWDDSFANKALHRAAVVRLEIVPEVQGNTVVGYSLYALTPRGAFVYESAFDRWNRVGL